MDIQTIILDILETLCETEEVKENLDLPLFESGLLDSFGTVALLVEIEEKTGITVSISDFDRDEWATPHKIIEKVTSLQ